ncbi:hypothetical protein K0039_00120 [Terrisporobacter mayombei]|uniref:hypothetical protein n=1 Tax=Terrisporobacter mayombei TaxID=1541 RepID=UPI001D163228|nr:hypothetical protein [Terrisporobacter mayombei]MCC3866602.1 hypothetical protein [Terrisporobacter mayombei]
MTIVVPFGRVTSQITAFGSIYTTITGIDYNLLCIVFYIVSLVFAFNLGGGRFTGSSKLWSCKNYSICNKSCFQ